MSSYLKKTNNNLKDNSSEDLSNNYQIRLKVNSIDQLEEIKDLEPELEDLEEDHEVLDSPPPFLSGTLHLGHLLQYTVIDQYYRRKTNYYKINRPRSFVKNRVGFDSHGLPVELYIRNKFQDQGQFSSKLFTNSFIKKWYLLAKKKALESSLIMQKTFEDFHYSVSNYWYTFDKDYKELIDQTLRRAYNLDLLKLEDRVSIFCPSCRCCLTNSQTDYQLVSKKFYQVEITIQKIKYLVVTTKLPYIFVNQAILYNENDQRYKNFNKKWARVRIAKKICRFKLYSSSTVDMQLGQGLEFLASWGGPRDISELERLKLTGKNLLDQDGYVSISPKYKNLNYQSFNDLIIDQNLLDVKSCKIRENKILIHSERKNCRKMVHYRKEPHFYIKIRPLKDKIEQMINSTDWGYSFKKEQKELLKWLDNANDWCISRNNLYGQEIGFWWCKKCLIFSKEKRICRKCLRSLKKTPLTLDCWFESGHSWLKALELSERARVTRIQGLELIRSWLYYSYVIGAILDRQPLNKVVFTAMVCDSTGKKLSKSNKEHDKFELKRAIDSYNIESLRFWSLTNPTRNRVKIEEGSLKNSYSFFQKIKNSIKLLFLDPLVLKEAQFLTKSNNSFLVKSRDLISSQEIVQKLQYLKKTINKEGFCSQFTSNWYLLLKNYYIEVINKKWINFNRSKDNFKTEYRSILTLIFDILEPCCPLLVDELRRILPETG